MALPTSASATGMRVSRVVLCRDWSCFVLPAIRSFHLTTSGGSSALRDHPRCGAIGPLTALAVNLNRQTLRRARWAAMSAVLSALIRLIEAGKLRFPRTTRMGQTIGKSSNASDDFASRGGDHLPGIAGWPHALNVVVGAFGFRAPMVHRMRRHAPMSDCVCVRGCRQPGGKRLIGHAR